MLAAAEAARSFAAALQSAPAAGASLRGRISGLAHDIAWAHVAEEAGWRVKAILRTRRFFSKRQLVRHYKAQVLSFVESTAAAYAHVAASVLDVVDRVQRRFLREIQISEEDALCSYNLAPLHLVPT